MNPKWRSKNFRIIAPAAVGILVIVTAVSVARTVMRRSVATGGPLASETEALRANGSPASVSYADRLDALHESRARRRKISLERIETLYGDTREAEGFSDELATHAERLARLRRAGGISLSIGRDLHAHQHIFQLMNRELDRHHDAIDELEKKVLRNL
jgi:hypothetical protein